jgi:AhpD family alkylhydroperoxidase
MSHEPARPSIDYVARHQELQDGFRALSDAIGPTMSGFGKLHRSAMAPGALDGATKELIALAIGITTHCDGCIAFHVHDALRAGASRAQVEEAIGVAVMMGGGPAAVFGSDALTALHQFEQAGVGPT